MNLSKHFTLEEFTRSPTALRKGISNVPSDEVVENLKAVASFLEQVREKLNLPIQVTSGYRSPALNKAIGGAVNSAHVQGLAVDIEVAGLNPKTVAKRISEMAIDKFDQLIWEGDWVHIGLSLDAPRKQVLTATFINGKARYTVGIA